jgi:hypothetical protein
MRWRRLAGNMTARKSRTRQRARGGASTVGARSVNGCFGQLQPLRSHLLKDGARFAIGRHLCQLQAMGGVADVLLSFVD